MSPTSILLPVMTQKDAALLGALQLAFVGDTVYDLYVRTMIVSLADYPMKQTHKEAVSRVNATAQACALDRVLPLLSECEKSVVRRGRNVKQRPPKNANPAFYQKATGFEALIGFLYLSGQNERLDFVVRVSLEGIKEGNSAE